MDRDRVVVDMWGTGSPVREIGAVVGRNPGWVSVRAAALGLPARSPRVTAAEKEDWCAAYRAGSTIADIARRSGRYPATIRKALIAARIEIIDGATRARRWPVRHDAFAEPLTPEAWYWIGFLAADGYVRRSHLSLGLKRSSAPALHRFLEFVGSPRRPLIRTARGRQLAAVVNSPRIAADVGQHGVLPGKTLSLSLSREAATEPAFWLGYVDGDGCVCMSRTGVPTIHLVGTRSVMEDASTFISLVVPDRRPSVHRQSARGVLWTVRASGHTARELARCLLASHPTSLEPKRWRLEQASTYQSRVTRAKDTVRRRPCEVCGIEVERMPSQFTSEHVFCSPEHYHDWRRNRSRDPAALRNSISAG